jgi:ribonuclease HI
MHVASNDIQIWTDAATDKINKHAGIGVVIISRNVRVMIQQPLGCNISNDEAELFAAYRGLEFAKEHISFNNNTKFFLFTDSKYTYKEILEYSSKKTDSIIKEKASDIAKSLNIRVIKIKSKCGLIHHDKADLLAKNGKYISLSTSHWDHNPFSKFFAQLHLDVGPDRLQRKESIYRFSNVPACEMG